MYNDFLQIKSLEGELKLSHKKKNFGLTVSTKELVYQKPHVNYFIRLEDIVSITPYEAPPHPKLHVVARLHKQEIAGLAIGENHYRIFTKGAVMHSRSGMFRLGPTDFVLPVMKDLLLSIVRYAQLEGI